MKRRRYKRLALILSGVLIIVFIVPFSFAQYIKIRGGRASFEEEFPVTVDIANKTIVEDAKVEAYLEKEHFNVQALALFSGHRFDEIFLELLAALSEVFESRSLAIATGERVVTILPGLRKEEVANIFGASLRWSEAEKKMFLTPQEGAHLPMIEGTFFPGVYVVRRDADPLEVQALVNERFSNNVLSRYASSTARKVPLSMALNIASLLERETIGTEDMRIISGIIWNRIFDDMNLQLDATLQYVKATRNKNSVWWPQVKPDDKFIRSPYNTYLNEGLPPTPIANPSVAAIIAALNPEKTDCMFYFHDDEGDFFCSVTYAEHVAMLKERYGRGR